MDLVTVTELIRNIVVTLAHLPTALVVVCIIFLLVWKLLKRFYKITVSLIVNPKVRKGLVLTASSIAIIIWLIFISVTSAQKEWATSTTIPFASFMTSAVFLLLTMLIDVFWQSGRRNKYIAMYILLSLSFAFIIAYDALIQRTLWEKIVNPIISAGVGALVSWIWFQRKIKPRQAKLGPT